MNFSYIIYILMNDFYEITIFDILVQLFAKVFQINLFNKIFFNNTYLISYLYLKF